MMGVRLLSLLVSLSLLVPWGALENFLRLCQMGSAPHRGCECHTHQHDEGQHEGEDEDEGCCAVQAAPDAPLSPDGWATPAPVWVALPSPPLARQPARVAAWRLGVVAAPAPVAALGAVPRGPPPEWDVPSKPKHAVYLKTRSLRL
jgi:hypothetical protein